MDNESTLYPPSEKTPHSGITRRNVIKAGAAMGACAGAAGILGCQSEKPKEKKAEAPTDAKDTLTIFVGEDFEEGFDPLTSEYNSNGMFNVFHSYLLKFDNNAKIVPDLAESFKVSEDGLTYTYTLKKGIKFSDGSPLTAEDVAFSYLTIRDNGAGQIDFKAIADVKALNETTVEFKLKRRDSSFVTRTAKLGIVPKKGYAAKDYRMNPIGSGPFKMVKYEPGQQLIVEPNPQYYGKKSQFKRITFLFLSNETALAHAQSGKLDVVMVQPEYAKEKVAGMHLVTLPTIDTRGFHLPTFAPKKIDGKEYGNSVTADIAVRKALNIGINRKEIVEHSLNGIGTPATALLHNMPWANPAAEFKDGRLEEAKKILEDAGWKLNKDGIREKNGTLCAFNMLGISSDMQRYDIAVGVAEQAKKLGIKITPKAYGWKQARTLTPTTPLCWGTGDYDPSGDLVGYFGSKGSINDARYSNPTVDKHIEEALDAKTNEEAYEIWKKVQWDGKTGPESENGDLPYLWIVTINHTYFVKDDLDIGKQLVHPHGHGWPVAFNLSEWKRK